jgi:ribosomal protein S18 acetylase RimI-like enzyme
VKTKAQEGRTMELTIRRATLADYEPVCQVLAEVDALHQQALPGIFQTPPGPARDPEYIASVLADENSALFVAVVAGHLAGVAQVMLRDASPIPVLVPRRFAIVDSLAVRAAFRRRGVGQKLMAAVEEWAADRGISDIELNVFEFNRAAIAFYERLGYTTRSRRMARTLS